MPERPTLRSGFTTGSAASASAKAAALELLGLLPDARPCPVDIPLPDGARLTVPVDEVADAPDLPDPTDATTTPDTPDAANTPDTPKTPDAPTPETPTPDVPDTPDAPDTTDATTTPGAPTPDAAVAPPVTGSPPAAARRVRAVTVKDGGDDPDVTHQARIGCTVWFDASLPPGDIRITGGPGVGVVTLPGLPVDVGRPAINPGPLAQIRAALAEALAMAGHAPGHGLTAVVDVEDGEALATRTMNPRLGIVGGVSILGTSGIVKPFSHEAWKGAVSEALDVARAMGVVHVGLSTGRRSEKALRRALPQLPEQAFVQIADFFGFSLEAAAGRGFSAVTLCAYPGKLVKMAMGLANTHAHLTDTDFAALADWCRQAGIAADVCAAVATANTVRHALELTRNDPAFPGLPRLLVRKALAQARIFAGPGPRLDVAALDYDDRAL
ncbi:MAG: cobalt-precorrin-5B (C(1))-methyltransferase CbiD [Desulfovibrionaceae bacterium]|nr:cobalt-precorrin-5B (C(1))-methyltransferase CbiD [Desulfovibrionaceae bacterium]